MADFTRSAALAKRLIEKNGRAVTLVKSNRTPANVNQPWRGPSTAAPPASAQGGDEIDAIAVFVPTSGSGLGRRTVDDPERPHIRNATDIALVASDSLGAGADLSVFDFLRDGSKLWKITGVQELRPSSTSVLWEVGLSR